MKTMVLAVHSAASYNIADLSDSSMACILAQKLHVQQIRNAL